MNSSYEKALMKIITFAPNAKEFIIDANTYEFVQIKQFESFCNYLIYDQKDEEFENQLNEFVSANNYFIKDEGFDINLMFSHLYDGLENFESWSNQMTILFELNLQKILKTGGFFGQKIDLKMIDEFLDCVEYLNAIRIKCICYLATACVLKKLYPYNSTRIELKNILRDIYEINVEDVPTKTGAMFYITSFKGALFMFSE